MFSKITPGTCVSRSCTFHHHVSYRTWVSIPQRMHGSLCMTPKPAPRFGKSCRAHHLLRRRQRRRRMGVTAAREVTRWVRWVIGKRGTTPWMAKKRGTIRKQERQPRKIPSGEGRYFFASRVVREREKSSTLRKTDMSGRENVLRCCADQHSEVPGGVSRTQSKTERRSRHVKVIAQML